MNLAGLLWRAVRYRPLALALDFALALAEGALGGAAVAALGQLVDRRDLAALLLWGGVLLAGGVCGRLRPLLSRRAQQGIREALGGELADAAVRLPYEDFERRDVRLALERARGVLQGDRVYHMLQTALTVVTEVSRMAAVAAVLTRLSAGLAVPVAAAVGVQVWADVVRVRQRFDLDAHTRAHQGFVDALGGLLRDRTVNAEARVFGAARWLIARWRRPWLGLQAAHRALALREMRRDALVRGSALAVYVGAFAYGVVLARQGALSAGGVVALAAGVRSAQQAVEEISYQIAGAHGHGLHLRDALAVLRRARGAPDALPPLPARDVVTLRGIRYGYPGARHEALRGASLRLRRGHPLALVGENGSGKTTLARVLLGLLPPSAGTVEGDGGEVLRRSAVLQDYARYALTLRENVGVGDVARMAQDAAVHSAIAAAGTSVGAPGGAERAARLGLAGLDLETPLGASDGGLELSGGQWQAVAGARGIFARGDLLVLDEPTAALDPLAERAVLARFAELARDRFALIVTHRMGAAALAAEVAVMRRGRVVEAGTHAELVAAGGLYARMWEAQARWYTARGSK